MLLCFAQMTNSLSAQTRGLIIRPSNAAGKLVLDPNLDGYISQTNAGFKNNDVAESELPLQPMILPYTEPTADTRTGPTCGFTDFVDNPDLYNSSYFGMIVVGGDTNLVFRFRLGNFAPNSKGYSILIDTDGKFGNVGPDADPNYVPGNPGFEMEIILVTNFGVRLYDVDGVTNGPMLTQLPASQYHQVAIAHTTTCSPFDYFYDFYMPLSVIQTYFPSFNSGTPIRMVANTVINTLSALRGGISDMAGIADGDFRSADAAWTELMGLMPPTSVEDGANGFPAPRTPAPFITSSLISGNTVVSGTSSQPNGTVIHVYRDGVLVGTTTVSSGTWSFTFGTALAAGEIITATATATGLTVSELSNEAIVASTCSPQPTITCATRKAVGVSYTTMLAGTVVRVYEANAAGYPVPVRTNTLVSDATEFLSVCNASVTNCNSGPNCDANGTFWATIQLPGECESPLSDPECVGSSNTANVPVITSALDESSTSVSGTGVTGHVIFLFKNGYPVATTTVAGGIWSFTGQSFSFNDVVTVRGKNGTSCVSAAASATVSGVATPPVVNGPIAHGATSVSGSSTEAPGTTINVFVGGSPVGTATVGADGTWTLTGLTALSAGQVVNATATVTGKPESALSNSVTVLGNSTPPVITGAYVEQGTQVSGTSSMANGTLINLYIDGVLIGTTTVNGGNWTVSGLSAFDYDLYAGGILTATATGTGLAESLPSNAVEVDCLLPDGNLLIDVIGGGTCLAASASIELPTSELFVIYTVRDTSDSFDRGTSRLGNGGQLILATLRLVESEDFLVKAMKLPVVACQANLQDTAKVNVTIPPNTTGKTPGDYIWIGGASDSLWTLAENWVRWNGDGFQLVEQAPVDSNDVLVKEQQPCVPAFPKVVTAGVGGLSVCRNITIDTNAVVYMENSVDERTLRVRGNWVNHGLFVPENGRVIFEGDTLQTILNDTGWENFNNFEVKGGQTRVKLLSSIQIAAAGSLIVGEGKLELNQKTCKVLNPSDTAIQRRTTGMVISEHLSGESILEWKVDSNAGTYIFPMGNDSNEYIPIVLSVDSGNVGIVGIATAYSAQADSSDLPQGAEAVNSMTSRDEIVKRFWHFYTSEQPGAFKVDLTVTFSGKELPDVGIVDSTLIGMRAIRYNSADDTWDTSFAQRIFNPLARTVTTTGINRFSWWTLGGPDVLPLPVTLTSLALSCNDGNLDATWVTATEINNAGFLWQGSTDGSAWVDLDWIAGNGTQTEANTYTWSEAKNRKNYEYLRLIQEDFNGTLDILAVRTNPCANNLSKTALHVFPVPVNAGSTLWIELPPGEGFITAALRSINGTSGPEYTWPDPKVSPIGFPIPDLPPGPWMLSITRNGKSWNRIILISGN
jgi:hypothetical protein